MKQRIGAWGLRLTRWETDGRPPELRRYVAIAAPHTTNWDLLYLLARLLHRSHPDGWRLRPAELVSDYEQVIFDELDKSTRGEGSSRE